MNHKLLLCSVCVASALLTACGGSSSDEAMPEIPPDPVVVTEVPASAAASAEAYGRYTAGLAPSETTEPLGLDKVLEAPVSETAEPLDLA